MARISKADHSSILRMVDGEQRKVAEVAAKFGCTPANIYALLAKLRRQASQEVASPSRATMAPPVSLAVATAESVVPAATTDADLFAAAPMKAAAAPLTETAQAPTPAAEPASAPPRALSSPPANNANVTELPRLGAARMTGAVGAAKAKPGVALMMRTADGEENATPFRSLEDLLSAVKPILRAAARSPDAVWFCIQPVDLASLNSDAA